MKEAKIKFSPTYKYNIGNTNYLSCQKKYESDECCAISKLILNYGEKDDKILVEKCISDIKKINKKENKEKNPKKNTIIIIFVLKNPFLK